MDIRSEALKARHPTVPIDKLILSRWSPRSFSGQPLKDEDIQALFEAARWAPSSSNGQPWRFIYAKKGTAGFDKLFSLLAPGNQAWCKNASLLILIGAKMTDEKGRQVLTAPFVTGAAFENLLLEASSRGLAGHGMAGFDYEKAKEFFGKDIAIQAMCAIGIPAPHDLLPPELASRDVPSDRKPLIDIITELV